MVWVVHVEIAGQQQPDCFYITAGDDVERREITVGRPPAKSDAKPDIVVPEKSVSKVHALLCVETEGCDDEAPNRLIVTDRSRFGTSVNGHKMPSEGSQELHAGDRIQLAPKTFLTVSEQPLDVAVHPHHPRLEEVRTAARRAGARVTHVFVDASRTHVLYDAGDPVWTALAHGVLQGAPLVDMAWLQGLAAAGLVVGSLPEAPQPRELQLQLAPAQPPVRLPLPPPKGALRNRLSGLSFGYSSNWRDPGLAALLTELGGRVVADRRQQGNGGAGAGAGAAGPLPPVIVVAQEGQQSGDRQQQQQLDLQELLVRLLTSDAAALRQALTERLQAAAPAPAAEPFPAAAAPEPADSDVTQEAAADEEEGGEVAQPRGPVPPLAPNVKVEPPGTAPDVRQASPSGRHAAARPGPTPTEGDPRGMANGAADEWMAAARRPEDTDAAATAPAGHHHHHQTPPQELEDGDRGPRLKRQRTDTGAPQLAAAAPPSSSAPPTGPPSASISRQLLSVSVSQPNGRRGPLPLAQPAQPAQPTHPHLPAQEDVPWMTQHPYGRSGAAATARRSSGAAAGADTASRASAAPASTPVVAAPAVAVKKEAALPLTVARPSKSRAKGKASAGDDGFEVLVPPRVKEEAPEVADASAQVVEEVDLFATTPDQLPPRHRSGSVEPFAVGSAGGGGGEANGSMPDGHGGSLCGTTTQQLRDFKLFRKQSGQAPALVVQPLPVFLVDNFHNEAEAEAIMRQEEERANKKRRADEAFKASEPGARKVARGTKRH